MVLKYDGILFGGKKIHSGRNIYFIWMEIRNINVNVM